MNRVEGDPVMSPLLELPSPGRSHRFAPPQARIRAQLRQLRAHTFQPESIHLSLAKTSSRRSHLKTGLDHIIIGRSGHFSLADEGLL